MNENNKNLWLIADRLIQTGKPYCCEAVDESGELEKCLRYLLNIYCLDEFLLIGYRITDNQISIHPSAVIKRFPVDVD
jgi:hypothetical protein